MSCTRTREIRITVPVVVDDCRVDVADELPVRPTPALCPTDDLELCYAPGEAWRLRALVATLVAAYRQARACERATRGGEAPAE